MENNAIVDRMFEKIFLNPADVEMLCEISEMLGQVPIDDGGGSSLLKTYLMARLIEVYNYKASVDIGVYRGRSFFPQALAHKKYTGGMAYGIDPYSRKSAQQEDIAPRIKQIVNEFMNSIDFDTLCNDVKDKLRQFGLRNHGTIIRNRSVAAVEYFRRKNIQIGLLHIDGNHDTDIVLQDISLYMPLLSRNGILIMDDISWPSIEPAYQSMCSKMKLVFSKVDTWNDFAIFASEDNDLLRS